MPIRRKRGAIHPMISLSNRYLSSGYGLPAENGETADGAKI
jgi:hypothetical protein